MPSKCAVLCVLAAVRGTPAPTPALGSHAARGYSVLDHSEPWQRPVCAKLRLHPVPREVHDATAPGGGRLDDGVLRLCGDGTEGGSAGSGRGRPSTVTWELTHLGLTTVVDTSRCGFKKAPQYFVNVIDASGSALRGEADAGGGAGGAAAHMQQQGSNCVYDATATGFRLFSAMRARGLSAAERTAIVRHARRYWRVSWLAATGS